MRREGRGEERCKEGGKERRGEGEGEGETGIGKE